MPSHIDPYAICVWFCVGFFVGAGWSLAAVIVARVFTKF